MKSQSLPSHIYVSSARWSHRGSMSTCQGRLLEGWFLCKLEVKKWQGNKEEYWKSLIGHIPSRNIYLQTSRGRRQQLQQLQLAWSTKVKPQLLATNTLHWSSSCICGIVGLFVCLYVVDSWPAAATVFFSLSTSVECMHICMFIPAQLLLFLLRWGCKSLGSC
jgi:hypothetical protein